MADRFKDKVVLITGAAGGFGAEAARRFATEGAKLALSDVAPMDQLSEELGDVLIDHVDVSNESDHVAHISHILERFGRLDIALNNAGIGERIGPLTKTTVEEFDRTMAINARGVFLGMKHQLPHMIEAGQGAILNVASAAGVLGAGNMAAYAASKHAVIGLTRAAADEVARKGVRVNAICPSFAATPLFNAMADQVGARSGTNREEAYAQISKRVPMRRVAEIGEVVQAMLSICDPANTFMTGQAISVDGGLSAV